MNVDRVADDAWQLSPSASLIRVGDAWPLGDPARGSHRILNALPAWLGQALAVLTSAGTVTLGQASDDLARAGVPEAHVDFCLRSLADAGVLVEYSTDIPERDAGNLRDRQWAVISPPADYRDPGTKDADVQLMYSYAEEDEPPVSSTQAPETWARTPLPRLENNTDNRFLERLGRLLYLTYGVHSEMDFGPLPRSRRTPPSFGASHPFDICVTTSQVSGTWATHYYQPSEHSLVTLPASQYSPGAGDFHESCGSGDITLSIHLAIERVHWRYRTSTVYPTVLLDLGHLTETLRLVAESMRIGLTVTAGRTEPALPKSDQVMGPRLRQYRACLETRG
ncbi:hypothetical protein [Streptomyces chryseus]